MKKKLKFATEYRLSKARQLQDHLINGVTTDKERYMYDYLSSLAARLDTCMLQIHLELKRIHKKPIYAPHTDHMYEIVPIHREFDPLPDAELEKMVNTHFDPIIKEWGDLHNDPTRLTQSEKLRDTQIEYI